MCTRYLITLLKKITGEAAYTHSIHFNTIFMDAS